MRNGITSGLLLAGLAAATFGMSGAIVKPLLESGWSPVAAVSARAMVGGVLLLPSALLALRGRWSVVWEARWRLLGMALVGVAGTQVLYFAAIQRIPVSVGILVEYLAPVLLVLVQWATTRRAPAAVVLVGSALAVSGLTLVVAPGASEHFDTVGLLLALIAMTGCAGYYVIAARPSRGLPAMALASGGLLIGGLTLGAIGASGLLPFAVSVADVSLFGGTAPWWLPLLLLGLFATAIGYASSLAATALLGSRLASFVGLLEVVAASLYAWLLLGEQLGVVQVLGGLLILGGIVLVRADAPAGDSALTPSRASEHRGESLDLASGRQAGQIAAVPGDGTARLEG